MKRCLFLVVLSYLWLPHQAISATEDQGWFQGAWSKVIGPVKECIWGPTQHARDVVRTQQGKPDIMGSDPEATSTGTTARQVLYGAAHVAASGLIAYAIGDWVGLYADITGGAVYGVVTAATTIWTFAAAVGNNRLLPSHLITNAINSELPLARRGAVTALTAVGTGLGVLYLPEIPYLASGHKTQNCLATYLFREGMGYVLGILLIERAGGILAVKFMPKPAGEKRGTTSLPWHAVQKLCESSSQIFSMYWMVYNYLGWVGFARQCQENGLGTPNPLNDSAGFEAILEGAFLKTLVGTGIMGVTLFPYLKKKGRATGQMIEHYVETQDPVLLTTLGLSAFLSGTMGGAIADYTLNSALPSLGPLVTVSAVLSGVFSQFPPTLATFESALAPGLTGAFTVTQAAQGWHPTGPTPSASLIGVVRSACVMFGFSLTSLIQEGVEGTVRAFLVVTNKKPKLLKDLNRWTAEREITAQGPYLENPLVLLDAEMDAGTGNSRAERVTAARTHTQWTVNPINSENKV